MIFAPPVEKIPLVGAIAVTPWDLVADHLAEDSIAQLWLESGRRHDEPPNRRMPERSRDPGPMVRGSRDSGRNPGAQSAARGPDLFHDELRIADPRRLSSVPARGSVETQTALKAVQPAALRHPCLHCLQ